MRTLSIIIVALFFIAASQGWADPLPQSDQCQYRGESYKLNAHWSPDNCNKCVCVRKVAGAEPIAACTVVECIDSPIVTTKELNKECTPGAIKMAGKDYLVDCDGSIREVLPK